MPAHRGGRLDIGTGGSETAARRGGELRDQGMLGCRAEPSRFRGTCAGLAGQSAFRAVPWPLAHL